MIRVAPILGEDRVTMVKVERARYLGLVITNAKQNLGIEETVVFVQRISVFERLLPTPRYCL